MRIGKLNKDILIIEDDADINNLLAAVLQRGGYGVAQAYSGTEGKLLLGMRSFALVVTDLMLPGCSGEELIEVIRRQSGVPIIVLSAKETPEDKIQALRSGADDYMTKPFHAEELLARVEAALRRAGQAGGQPSILAFADVVLDTAARTVAVGGVPVALTLREFDILALLMGSPQRVFTKANIYQSVWNEEFYGDDNTVNVHISNLRAKLGKGEYIQTVWGIGFKMHSAE